MHHKWSFVLVLTIVVGTAKLQQFWRKKAQRAFAAGALHNGIIVIKILIYHSYNTKVNWQFYVDIKENKSKTLNKINGIKLIVQTSCKTKEHVTI